MGDKFLLTLMVVFFFLGIASYENYMQSNGKMGPVAQLIDFCKLSNLKEVFGSSSTKRQTVQFNVKEGFDRLSKKYHEIEDKRKELVEHRTAILQELSDLVGDLQGETKEYYAILDAERMKMKERFPELEQLGKNIFQPQQADFAQFKKQLTNLAQSMGSSSPEDIPVFAQLLERIDRVEKEGPAVKLDGCDDVGICIDNDLKQIETGTMDWFDQSVSRPQRYLQEIAKSTEQFKREHQILVDNCQASEQDLHEQGDNLQGRFKLLTEKLVAVTEADLKEIVQLYNEIEAEQESLLANLELNRRRLYESYNHVVNQFERVHQVFGSDPNALSLDLVVERVTEIQAKQQNLFADLEANENQMAQLLDEHSAENGDFVKQFLQVKKAMNQQEYMLKTHEAKAAYRLNPQQPIRQSAPLKNLVNPNPGKSQNPSNANSSNGIDRARERDKYHTPVNRGMDRLKDKARQEGFYN